MVDNGGKDRLSSLSDDILVDILRLLPFHKAVATSVLSKRWVPLWTHHTSIVIPLDKFMPRLRFGFPKPKRTKYILNSIPTVSHILGQLTSPYLTTLEIYSPDPSDSKAAYDAISSCFEHWLGLICGHNIQVINLSVGNHELWDKLFVWLPSCIFQTKSLVKLVLKNVNYNCRLPSVITLPNLKHLELTLGCLDDFHRRLLGNLSESLPLLQILCLHFHWTDGLYLINLSSPSLHSLSVVVSNPYDVIECWKIVIDAPNLEYINISGKNDSLEFVSNPTALATAVIETSSEHPDMMLGLIKGISYARSLTVLNYYNDFLETLNFCEDNGSLPLFNELIELHIVFFEEQWRFVDRFPAMMLAKVKKIQIEYKDGFEKEMKLLKCILSSSSFLELLLVSVTHPCNGISPNEDRKICEAVLMLERSSKNCRIQFTGNYSTGSSFTSEIGDLVCETAVNYSTGSRFTSEIRDLVCVTAV